MAPRYFPRLLYHVKIPALGNARLLQPPTKSKRWPVMIFSHGLGGSRNAYSHVVGSLASHGIVVVAPEHRDGSAPVTFVRSYKTSKPTPIDYRSISHQPSIEVEEARDKQLKLRLWELASIHDLLLNLDKGESLQNLAVPDKHPQSDHGDLSMFASSLDVLRPGSIAWSGHSFGAATIVQFVKSTFYRPNSSTPKTYQPLFVPADDSPIVKQITPGSPVSLLDLWTLPLRSASKTWLWEKPLPCYSAGGPGGSNVVAILSEAFVKWKGNLIPIKKAVSAHPSDNRRSRSQQNAPHIFYPVTSAHLSQSDFGILFPWLTKKVLKAEEPERTLLLNVRAILEVLRQNGMEVADTTVAEMEEVEKAHPTANGHTNGFAQRSMNGDLKDYSHQDKTSLGQDRKILLTDGSIRGWIALDVDEDDKADEGVNVMTKQSADPSEAVMEGEAKWSENEADLKL